LEELLIEIFEGWVFLSTQITFPILMCLMGVGSFETLERKEWREWKVGKRDKIGWRKEVM